MFLLVSTVLNVALDILFVAKFNMVCPVALATVIAQAVSAAVLRGSWKMKEHLISTVNAQSKLRVILSEARLAF